MISCQSKRFYGSGILGKGWKSIFGRVSKIGLKEIEQAYKVDQKNFFILLLFFFFEILLFISKGKFFLKCET